MVAAVLAAVAAALAIAPSFVTSIALGAALAGLPVSVPFHVRRRGVGGRRSGLSSGDENDMSVHDGPDEIRERLARLEEGGQGLADHRDLLAGQQRVFMRAAERHRAASVPSCRAHPLVP